MMLDGYNCVSMYDYRIRIAAPELTVKVGRAA